MMYLAAIGLLAVLWGCSMEPQVTVENVQLEVPITLENCQEMIYAAELCVVEFPELNPIQVPASADILQ